MSETSERGSEATHHQETASHAVGRSRSLKRLAASSLQPRLSTVIPQPGLRATNSTSSHNPQPQSVATAGAKPTHDPPPPPTSHQQPSSTLSHESFEIIKKIDKINHVNLFELDPQIITRSCGLKLKGQRFNTHL